MKKRGKNIMMALVIVLAAAAAFACPALASDGGAIDLTRNGSISVTLLDNGTKSPASGAVLTLYRVASAYDSGYQLAYTFTDEFEDCGMSLDDLRQDGLETHLAAYADEQGLSGAATKTANANGRVTFSDLDAGLYLVRQTKTTSGYYSMDPFLVSVPMTIDSEWVYNVDASPKVEAKTDSSDSPTTRLTVSKVWASEGVTAPDSVTVTLLRDGTAYQTAVLNGENDWSYTWRGLNTDHTWDAAELDVPDGYEVSYFHASKAVTITNTSINNVPRSLTVQKIWDDGGAERPDQISVELLRNGSIYETVKFSDENGWIYTWDNLDAGYSWSAVESEIPTGYTAFYSVSGYMITIKNTTETKSNTEPVTLGVEKEWVDDGTQRPEHITVDLLKSGIRDSSVILSEENGWSYTTWTGLNAQYSWSVVESDVPEDYTVSYSASGSIVTITNISTVEFSEEPAPGSSASPDTPSDTNTPTLIQTGQLNWPVPVLAGLGILLLALGWMLVSSKKKSRHD